MDLYAKVQLQIESKLCLIHDKPLIAFVSNGNVMLSCCCTDFEIDCYNEIVSILQGKLIKVPVAIEPADNTEPVPENDIAHSEV